MVDALIFRGSKHSKRVAIPGITLPGYRNWTENDREGIEAILKNPKYTEQSTDDLRAFRESSQSAIVENMRRNTDAMEERVLIKAFDYTHPDWRGSTRPGVSTTLSAHGKNRMVFRAYSLG
jgi:hypothetical protein